MNKNLLMAIGAMAIATVLGLIFSQNLSVSAGPDLTEKEVTEKVEAQYPGEITALKLDEQETNPIYEVEIVIDGQGYELVIDGNSGEVLKLEEKWLAKADEKKDMTTDKQKENGDKREASATNKKETDLEMKEKATGDTKETERKTVTAPKQEDAEEAKKEDNEAKKGPNDDSKKQSDERKSTISQEKAIEIALKQFSGVVDDIDLDREDGRLIYEIEIESPEGEAEIEIDAYTGEVLVVDIDLDD